MMVFRTVAIFAIGVALLGLPTSGSAQHWGVIRSILDGSTDPGTEVSQRTSTVLRQPKAQEWSPAATKDSLFIGDSLLVAARTSVSVTLAGGDRKGSLIFLAEVPIASSFVRGVSVRTPGGIAPALAKEARYEIREDPDTPGAIEVAIAVGALVVNLQNKAQGFAVRLWDNIKASFTGTKGFFIVDDSLGIIFLESGEISLGEGVMIQSGGLWEVRRGQVQSARQLNTTRDEISVLNQATRKLTPSPGFPIPTPLAIGGVALLATILAVVLLGGDDAGIAVPLPNF